MKRLIRKLLGIKELNKNALYTIMHCSCDFGIVVCNGCTGEKPEYGVCAGCAGEGIVACGKCGGINSPKLRK